MKYHISKPNKITVTYKFYLWSVCDAGTERPIRDILESMRNGQLSKAAEALNYTQSGISQMMAGLEEELGVQLFARINRGVTLTDNGTRLLPYIRELANQKNRLRQAAFNINHKVEGKLRVGSFSSITTLWI